MISVGIDIGSFSIKVVEIDASTTPFQIQQINEFPLSQDPNKDRKIEIVDILRTYLARYEGTSVYFIMGVPEWKTSIRRRVFPFKERHKILKSLPFELEDDIPFTLEDSIFEAKISRYVGPAAEVIALACPEETVAEEVQLAKDLGIELHTLSVDGLVLPNLFTPWWNPPPQEMAEFNDDLSEGEDTEDEFEASAKDPEQILNLNMHLHIGHRSTTVLFLAGNVLKAVRNIDWGGEMLAEAISKKYSMHYIDALKEVQKKAFLLTSDDGASKDQIVFSDTLKAEVEKLVHELRLTIVEIESELTAKIQSAKISGGVSKMKNLGPYLTTKIECPFNKFPTFDSLPSNSTSNDPHVEAISPIAIGLAIEGIKKPRNPAINLLKGRFSKQGQGLKPLWKKWGHTIQVGMAALIFLFLWSSFRSDQARFLADEAHFEMKTLAQNIAGLPRSRSGSISSVERFLRQQDRIDQQRDSANKVNQILSAMDILQSISTAIPKTTGVDVKALSIDNELAIVQGEVSSASAAQAIRTALKQLSSNGKIRTKAPNFEPSPGKRAFGFSISVERVEDGL
jgi:general secretion pathway protein L